MTTRVMGSAVLAVVLAGCGGGASAPPVLPSRTIALGGTATGTLAASDPRINDNSVYHRYRFSGRAGQVILVDVMSTDFDAFAILQDAQGTELARNDDGGEGLNARIMAVLPSNGTYYVIANTYRANTYGAYTLRLTSVGMAGEMRSGGTISRGQTVAGRLSESDPRLQDNSVYHAYLYRGRAGETITVDVMSTDFDAYTIIQDAAGNRIAYDDDGGEGLNARLTYTLPTSATYRIIANSFTQGATGLYVLSLH